jgi:hypothetical protein
MDYIYPEDPVIDSALLIDLAIFTMLSGMGHGR